MTHSPLEILCFLVTESGMNTEALGKVLGNKTAASLVLNGTRELSKAHIRKQRRISSWMRDCFCS